MSAVAVVEEEVSSSICGRRVIVVVVVAVGSGVVTGTHLTRAGWGLYGGWYINIDLLQYSARPITYPSIYTWLICRLKSLSISVIICGIVVLWWVVGTVWEDTTL